MHIFSPWANLLWSDVKDPIRVGRAGQLMNPIPGKLEAKLEAKDEYIMIYDKSYKH